MSDDDDFPSIPDENNIFDTINSPSLSLCGNVAAIAIFFSFHKTVVNAILAILRFLGHDVPKDARAVMKTLRTALESKSFVCVGLRKGIETKVRADPLFLRTQREIRINVNIDGIP